MMGMDPLTIGMGVSAASGLYGAITGNKNQQRAMDQSQQNYAGQQQWQQQQNAQLMQHNKSMQDLIGGYLGGQGESGINRLINGSGNNTGQDGLMQMMRRGGPGYQDDPQTTQLLRQLSGGGMQYGSGEADAALKGVAAGTDQMFDPRLTSALTQGATQGYGAGDPTGMGVLGQLAGQGYTDPTGIAAMQRAASGNTGFDTSPQFAALRGQSDQDLNDQLAQMRGQAGSLGQRFGSSMQNNEAQLRARATVGLNQNYANVAQGSWEAAQGRALQGAQGLLGQAQGSAQMQAGAAQALLGQGNAMLGFQQGAQGMLGQQSQAAMAARMNAAGQLQNNAMGQNQLASQNALGAASQMGAMNQQRNAFAQQNAQGQLGYAQLIAQLTGQQQAGNQQYNLGLLGMLNGQQSYLPTGAPQQQIIQAQNGLPDAIGNLGNMALMYPFLQQMMGGANGQRNMPGNAGFGLGGFVPQLMI